MNKDIFTKNEVISFLSKFNKEKNNMSDEQIKVWFEEKLNDDITKKEKLKYIVENESKILSLIMKGHKASVSDEFQPVRIKMKQYRKDLGLI
jgi:hypothetical protein